MKVRDIVKLIGDQLTIIEVGHRTYEFNVEVPGRLKVRRGLFVNYNTEEDEKEEVMNKDVAYITSDKPGVMKIIVEE